MSWRQKMYKQLMKSGNPTISKPSIREAEKKTRWKIVRGDKVQVIGNHPEAGKQGIVKQVIRKKDRIIVEGLNMYSKRLAGNPEQGIKGTTIMTERSIHYSKINLVDPLTQRPTKVSTKILKNGTRVRVSKVSGAVIPKPEGLMLNRKVANSIVTEDDTLDNDVWEVTFKGYNKSET
mmetsp:Transcript_18552/g.21331  ORF Transcript_18552/g.21331 Transcript_18552/m.21331 type:complete len:177 (-) Transcript_18552:491-1021(-)|eukprot:CAMPEP_0194133380 /NCGR_PEP_ID=MMETSP0152-20130528/3583_1 /TAXON_ID=1049557 /ORGANISM="Thalassiothrix antarctica, Strain L6-D1" /LENGTH=176 /DNA_ID=CAMNT_0038828691 /DNA_START=63 /DNA_END=593 /DNA_ORIENTATION=+